MSSSTKKIPTIIQRSPGLNGVARCSRKPSTNSCIVLPSTGDPTNPLFIPGLTLHLPPPGNEKDNLFTLFESCVRSNLRLKMKVTEKSLNFSAELFIEGNEVCTGDGPGKHPARDNAATKALEFLSEFQPIRYNTEKEMILKTGDRVQGLELHMDCGVPGKEDALDVLMRSCMKCNLPVTWWDDGGGDLLGAGCSAVMLINGKPICWGVSGDLDSAKKATAEEALEKLMGHPVNIGNETNVEEKRNTDGGHGGSIRYAKRKHSASNEKEANPNHPAEKTAAVTRSQKRQRTPQSPSNNNETEKLPNFTLFLPENYHSKEEMADHKMILLESCFINKVLIKVDCRNRDTRENEVMATLKLEDLNSDKSVTTYGYGRQNKDAKDHAAQKAVRILQLCQPCVYKKVQFLQTDDCVKGLTLYLTSWNPKKKEKTYLSQLEESLAKCNLLMSWWDDGGSYLFGPPWTLVLVINSRPVYWGCGHTMLKAKEHVAEQAVVRLKLNHPVVYANHPVENKSNKTINEQDSSVEPRDKFRFCVLSRWIRRDGEQYIDGSSNKLIENQLQKLLAKCV